ncbi:MAG: serine/threonine protein phosphatase [Ruminococcaceae bacterium]|nr:serine/threonine protein phosphatase [Oscillospiraceae bacterium]
MALFAIGDLHLPLGVDKPMDIFGKNWENYVERLKANWVSTVSDNDTVVLPGDFSWATYISESKADFDFLNALPGRKIILKGNHDYWWTTMNKMKEFIAENGYNNIDFLQNNSFEYEGYSICGTRGWQTPSPSLTGEDKKIYDREILRLDLSIKAAKYPDNIIVFTHFPPVLKDYRENAMVELLKKYKIKKSIFGHIHSSGIKNVIEGDVSGIDFTLVSCDYREFMPVKILD